MGPLNLLHKWQVGATVFAVFLLLLAATYAKGRHDGWNAHKADEAHRLAKAREVDAAAKEQASVERSRDLSTVSQRQKELTDADNAVPDSRPSAARVAFNCQRLRQQGDASKLPAECRPDR